MAFLTLILYEGETAQDLPLHVCLKSLKMLFSKDKARRFWSQVYWTQYVISWL